MRIESRSIECGAELISKVQRRPKFIRRGGAGFLGSAIAFGCSAPLAHRRDWFLFGILIGIGAANLIVGLWALYESITLDRMLKGYPLGPPRPQGDAVTKRYVDDQSEEGTAG